MKRTKKYKDNMNTYYNNALIFRNFSIIIIISLAIVTMIVILLNSHIDKIIEALKDNDFDTAEAYYVSYIKENDKEVEELNIKLTTYMSEVYDTYNETNSDYTYIVKKYKFILETLECDGANEYISKIAKLATSKDAYEKGMDAYRNSNYDEAIENFQEVKEEDMNYDEAVLMIQSSQTSNNKKMIKEMEEAMDNLDLSESKDNTSNSEQDSIETARNKIEEIYSKDQSGNIDIDSDSSVNNTYIELCGKYADKVNNKALEYSYDARDKEAYNLLKKAITTLNNVKYENNESTSLTTLNQLLSTIESGLIDKIKVEFNQMISKEQYYEAYSYITENKIYVDEKTYNDCMVQLFDKIN